MLSSSGLSSSGVQAYKFSSNVATSFAGAGRGSPGVTPSFSSQLSVPSHSREQKAGLVWLDHCYAKPWNLHPEASNAKPVRYLFMTKYPRAQTDTAIREQDIAIDVESVEPTSSQPYDASKAFSIMNECNRHIKFARVEDIGDEWEDRIAALRTGWTSQQNRLFHKVLKALYTDRLARLTYEGHPNEPIQRRIHIDKSARRIRQALAGVLWDPKLTHWLHGILVENLSQQLLSAYLDILQVIRAKVPSLIDKMLAPMLSRCTATTVEAMTLLLKRPWDPTTSVVSHHKLKKLPGNPLLVVVPSAPMGTGGSTGQLRRSRMWHHQLSSLGKVVQVVIHGSAGSSVAQFLENMISAARTKVIELRGQNPNRPIVLVGWNVGSLIACHVSLIEPVTGVVCLGFPHMTISGPRGDVDDTLLASKTPTLFVVGQLSEVCKLDNLEDLREKMRVETSLVVVGGADANMRVTHAKKKQEGVTQSIVDRCIQDELSEFLGGVISQSNAMGGYGDSGLDGEVKRKPPRKKKVPKDPSQKLPSVAMTTAQGAPVPKAPTRTRVASLTYFDQMMALPTEDSNTAAQQLSLSRSYDSRLLALGLQAQRSQAKKTAVKRKKTTSVSAEGSTPAKRRNQRSTSIPATSLESALLMSRPSAMPTMPQSVAASLGVPQTVQGAAELSGLLTGHLLQQQYTQQQSVAALQAALALRRPAPASGSSSLPTSMPTTPTTSTSRLALTVSSLQERLKTSTSQGTQVQTRPQVPSPASAKPSTVMADSSLVLSPIRSALAAAPLSARHIAPYGSAASQMQNLLTTMVRQSNEHAFVSSASQFMGIETQKYVTSAAGTRLTTVAPPTGYPQHQRTTTTETLTKRSLVTVTPPFTTPTQSPMMLSTATPRLSSTQEKPMAVQKLQFHDFPLTTATISRPSGTTLVAPTRLIPNPQLDIARSAAKSAAQLASPKTGPVPTTSSTAVTFTSVTETIKVSHTGSATSTATEVPSSSSTLNFAIVGNKGPKPSVFTTSLSAGAEPLGQVTSVIDEPSKKTMVVSRPLEASLGQQKAAAAAVGSQLCSESVAGASSSTAPSKSDVIKPGSSQGTTVITVTTTESLKAKDADGQNIPENEDDGLSLPSTRGRRVKSAK